jgi:D-alanyl-D-alanine carboxypeptidase
LAVKALPIVALALFSATAYAQDTKAIDAAVTTLMQKRGTPGLSLAVVKDGKIVYEKGYGLADVENDVPATPETVYEIGSMTKQFTAALTLQLVDEGKVKLDEPARTYLPELPEAWSKVTVRHLLTHTSGIKSYTEVPKFLEHVREPMKADDFLKLVSGEKADFEPGASWHYNNSGYYILGMLIERVTGKTYGAVLSERILTPLGMTSTFMNDPSAIVKHRSHGYNPNPKGAPANAPYVDMGWPYSAGAMISTVRDLAKWDAALYWEIPVKQSLLQQAWTKVKLNGGKDYGYGFGWFLEKINDIQTVEHGGDIPGFNADILRIPSKKLTVIALCNTDPGVAVSVTKVVAGLVDPALKVEVKAIADPDPKLTEAHKQLLAATANGTVKKELFTAEMQAKLFPDLIKGAQQFLTELGPLESFTLMKIDEKDGNQIRIYKATFGAQSLAMTVVTDKAGKISGLLLSPG